MGGLLTARLALVFSVLHFLILVTPSSGSPPQELQIINAERRIDLSSHIVKVFLTLKVENTGTSPASEILLAFPPAQVEHLALVKAAATAGKRKKRTYVPLTVNPTELPDAPNGTKFFSISLLNPLKAGETITLEVLLILTHSLEPFPVEISQSESQLVYYRDSAIILSPYHIKEQITYIKTPTTKVESYTRVDPTNRAGTELKYGQYNTRPPYSYSPILIHFENNHPFAVVEELIREVEISHWGSIQITEHYKLVHAGARHKGVFSRVEYQQRPSMSGISSFKQLVAKLPPRVHSVYYRDGIGNISTSHLRTNNHKSELEIEPRYPLFGGWKATFVIGYGLPLQDFLFESSDGRRYLNFSFGCPLADAVVDKLTIKVVLPEGSKDPSAIVPFPVEQHLEKSYSYLDVVGRTVVVLEKKNVVPDHGTPFQVYYNFNPMFMLAEPLMLVPVRSAAIDYCMRITDNGREIIHSKVLFIFSLYNNSNNHDHLKLGASSPEESASWIQSLNDAALKECPNPAGNVLSSSNSNWQKFRLNHFKGRDRSNSIDWTLWSSVHTDLATSDVVASSQWTIFGCQSGLRLFKEAKDKDIHGKHWNDHRAIMAIGVVDGASEAIFRTLMSLGPSRSEWDFCLCRGSVIERLDGHTDIIHKLLSRECLPRGMKRRDLLLQRYWRREDDGTYVILYHSVSHEKCRPQKGYVRACIKSGGYVIAPLNQGKQSVVKHMLAIDWKFWKSYLGKSSARSITVRMLGRVAALRELFRAKLGNYPCSDFSLGCIDSGLPQSKEDKKLKVQTLMEENSDVDDLAKQEVEITRSKSHNGVNESVDEFFDVPEPANCDVLENGWSSDCCAEHSQDIRHSKISKSAKFVKKLQNIAVQKKGYKELKGVAKEDSFKFHFGVTLPKDLTGTSACSWSTADPSTYLIRGDRYLNDHQKIKAKGTLMEMVAADWLRSDKREDDLGSRPGSIVQKYAAQGGPEFFFIINIQVPGVTTYGLALYYMTSTPLEDTPLLQSFVNGDDTYRNSRFKLIPNISQGSWIVKQSVGKKACLIGQSLQVNYFRGKNYLELGIDIGSSTVARGVVNLVLGYLNNLVIEMAFLIQANTSEELPEMLLGTCRLNHLDASKSVLIR